jgi:hypothetical protein
VLDLKHVVRSVLDGVRDGVAMRRPQRQGAHIEEVERALEQLALHRRSAALRHLNASSRR